MELCTLNKLLLYYIKRFLSSGGIRSTWELGVYKFLILYTVFRLYGLWYTTWAIDMLLLFKVNYKSIGNLEMFW